MHIPGDVESPVAFNRQAVLGAASYKLTIPRRQVDAQLVTVLSGTRLAPARGEVDLRWAIETTTTTGERLQTIYLTADGKEGYLDDQRVHIQGDLGRWLNEKFGNCLGERIPVAPEHP